ncbi:hypothetical protein KOW79_002398 [Hemibagrus wyckioides]|uniref:Uncharacterized protein n=1 Tax=Hemibagrus wyckioides TaxID=337641 RepID=A0A9D3P4L9_9TELE|nr:hypothetical protein KOW79_002398 [Hemibagrus wyckioides]
MGQPGLIAAAEPNQQGHLRYGKVEKKQAKGSRGERHTLYLTLAQSLLAPVLLICLMLFPESLVRSTPSTSGTGHMLDLLDWPGPHPTSSHTCFTALLHSKIK